VHAPDQGGQHMGVFRVVIVPGAIEIGGHGRDEIGAILAVVGVTHADTGNLGNGVGLVGGLQGHG